MLAIRDVVTTTHGANVLNQADQPAHPKQTFGHHSSLDRIDSLACTQLALVQGQLHTCLGFWCLDTKTVTWRGKFQKKCVWHICFKPTQQPGCTRPSTRPRLRAFKTRPENTQPERRIYNHLSPLRTHHSLSSQGDPQLNPIGNPYRV